MPQAVSLEDAFGGGGRYVDPATQAQRDAYASRITGGGRVVNGMMQAAPNDVSDEEMSSESSAKNQQELDSEIRKTKDPKIRDVLLVERGVSLEDAFGAGALAPKEKAIALDDAFPAEHKSDLQIQLGGMGAAGKAMLRETAGMVEMVLGMPAAMTGTIGEAVLKNDLNSTPGISRETASNTAEDFRKYISEKGAPTWLTDAVNKVTGGKDPEENPTAMAKLMGWADELINNAGDFYEKASGGGVNRADFTSTAYGVLNAFGIRGTAKIGAKKGATTPVTTTPRIEPTLPWQSVAEETKAGTDPTLHADYAQTVGQTPGTTLPTDPLAGPGRAPVGSTPPSPVASLAEKNASLPPEAAVAARGEAVKSARAAMPDDTQWAQYLKDYSEGEAKAAAEVKEGDAKIPTAAELMDEIKATPETAAETVERVLNPKPATPADPLYTEVKNSGLTTISQIQRQFRIGYTRAKALADAMSEDGAKEGFSDKAAKAVLVAGGVGAALAYAYGGDKKEDLSLAALGAGLILGTGRETIAKMSPDSSMAALRESSPTTLKVLEEIPGGWKDIPIKWLNDQLKRQDVTKPEKDLFQSVLDQWKDETHISAKELMVDLKGAMGSFELKKQAVRDYDDYGLDNIGRYDPDGHYNHHTESEVPGGTHVRAQTNIWELPEKTTEDASSNHFGNLNYFGHTRNFGEGGVKHVVELQSDLAQKSKAALSEEMRKQLQTDHARMEMRYSDLNKTVENFRDTIYGGYDAEVTARKFQRGVNALEMTIKMAEPTLGESYRLKADSALSNSKVFQHEDSALGRWYEEYYKTHPSENISVFDGLVGITAKKLIPEAEAKVYAGLLERAFARVRDDVELKKNELEVKLAASKNLSHLDPMMKNWAKRLIREELADTVRGDKAVIEMRRQAAQKSRAQAAEFAKNIEDYKFETGGEDHPSGPFIQQRIDYLLKDADRLDKPPPAIVRFATADTVARVEGWGDLAFTVKEDMKLLDAQIKKTEEHLAIYKTHLEEALAHHERIKASIPDTALDRSQEAHSNENVGVYQERVRSIEESLDQLKVDKETGMKILEDPAKAVEDTITHYERRSKFAARNGVSMTSEQMAAADAKLASKVAGARAASLKAAKAGHIFENPEHATIYDRYATDVEKFLKQLGGTLVTDQHGHTWYEVPTKPGYARSLQFGGAETKVLLGIAAVGMGIVGGMYLDKKNAIEGAVYGAIVGAGIATGGVSRAIRTLRNLAVPRPDKRIRINELTEHREYNEKTAAVAIWQAQNEIIKLLPKKADRVAVHEALDAGTQSTLVGKQKQAADLAQRFYDALSVLTKEIDVDRMGTKDLAEVVGIYGTAVARNIANKMFLTELKAATDTNGRPLVFGIKKAPKDFVLINNPLLQGVRVNPDIAPSLKFMFEAQEPGAVMAALSTFNTAIKRHAVSLSLFHAKALVDAALGAFNNPLLAGKVLAQSTLPRVFGENAYLKQLRENGPKGVVSEAIRDGLVFSLDRADAPVEDVGGGFYRGMAGIQRSLDKAVPGLHLGAPIALLSKINHAVDNFMWGRLHAGLKFEVYSAKREALVENSAKAGRALTEEQAGRIAAAYANDIFGGLNWQRLAEGATSRWGRDLALAAASPSGRRATQLLLFAPDWTLSTTRAFTQALTKDLKNVPSGLFSAKSIGDLHRQQLIRSAFFYAAVGDYLNYSFSGHHLWDKEQKDWTRVELGDGRSMQLSKHFNEPFHWVMHPSQQALNKLAYIPKEAANQALSTEYLSASGHMKPMAPGVAGRVRHALKGVTPIGMQQVQDGGMQAGVSGALGFPIYGQTEEQRRKERLEKALERYRQTVGVGK